MKIERIHSNVFLAALTVKEDDFKGALQHVDEADELAIEGEMEGWAKYILEKLKGGTVQGL